MENEEMSNKPFNAFEMAQQQFDGVAEPVPPEVLDRVGVSGLQRKRGPG